MALRLAKFTVSPRLVPDTFGIIETTLGIATFICLFHWAAASRADEVVKFVAAGTETVVQAELALPVKKGPGARSPAVVLLHSAAGWNLRVTDQYAKALGNAGFVTLQPQLFLEPMNANAPDYLPHAYGALDYLASRPDVDPNRIAIAGFSLGGIISTLAAVTQLAEKHGNSGRRFAAHAPFYPLCWIFADLVSGKMKGALPTEAYRRYTGVPVKIFSGALDDYDDRDPTICQRFVDSLPQTQRMFFSVQVYENATHRWETVADESRFNKWACKGRGCTNHNVPNPEVTRKSIADLVTFLSGVLRITP